MSTDWLDDEATSAEDKWARFMSMSPEPTVGPPQSTQSFVVKVDNPFAKAGIKARPRTATAAGASAV